MIITEIEPPGGGCGYYCGFAVNSRGTKYYFLASPGYLNEPCVFRECRGFSGFEQIKPGTPRAIVPAIRAAIARLQH